MQRLRTPRRLPRRLPILEWRRGYRASSLGIYAARSVAATRRAASFTLYSALVVGGLAFTGLAAYYFAKELLMPDSEVVVFQRAFALVEKDPTTRKLLGQHLKAHGEETANRWNRTRPLASVRSTDRLGREHLHMKFHVDGELGSGLVRLEMVNRASSTDFRYISLDVPGHKRHFVVNENPQRPKGNGLFGIRWGPKTD